MTLLSSKTILIIGFFALYGAIAVNDHKVAAGGADSELDIAATSDDEMITSCYHSSDEEAIQQCMEECSKMMTTTTTTTTKGGNATDPPPPTTKKEGNGVDFLKWIVFSFIGYGTYQQINQFVRHPWVVRMTNNHTTNLNTERDRWTLGFVLHLVPFFMNYCYYYYYYQYSYPNAGIMMKQAIGPTLVLAIVYVKTFGLAQVQLFRNNNNANNRRPMPMIDLIQYHWYLVVYHFVFVCLFKL